MGASCSRPRVGDVGSLPIVPIVPTAGGGIGGGSGLASSRPSVSGLKSIRPAGGRVAPHTPSSVAPAHSPGASPPALRDSPTSARRTLQREKSTRPSLLLTTAPFSGGLHRATTDSPLRHGFTVLDDLRMSSFGPVLPAGILADFARFFQVQHFGVGDCIFSPGDEAEALYLVRSGVVAIRAERPETKEAGSPRKDSFHARVVSDTASTGVPSSVPSTPGRLKTNPSTAGQSPTISGAAATTQLHERIPSITVERAATDAHALGGGTASLSNGRSHVAISYGGNGSTFGSGTHPVVGELPTPEHGPVSGYGSPPGHKRNSLSINTPNRRGSLLEVASLRNPNLVGSPRRASLVTMHTEESDELSMPVIQRTSRGSILARTLPLMQKHKHETFGQECLRSHQHLRVTWAIAETPVVLLAITTIDFHNFLAAYPEIVPTPPTSTSTSTATSPTFTPSSPPLVSTQLSSIQIRERIINSLGQTIDSVLEAHLDLGPAKLSLLTSLFNFVRLSTGDCLMKEGMMGSFVSAPGGPPGGGGCGTKSEPSTPLLPHGGGSHHRMLYQPTNNLYFLFEGSLSCTIKGDPSASASKVAKIFDASLPVTAGQPPNQVLPAPVPTLSNSPRQPPIVRSTTPGHTLGLPRPTSSSHPGFFGDLGLILDIPRTATIVALSDCVLLELQQDRWRNFLQLAPALLDVFTKRLTSSYSIHILHLLNQPLIARAFVEFCRSEYSLENYNAWHAMMTFRATFAQHLLHATRNKQAADDIVDRFIMSSADTPVNLKGLTVQTILTRWRAGEIDSDLFLEAEEEVLSLMNTDSFARFKLSSAFQRVLTEINATHLQDTSGAGTNASGSSNNPSPQQIARAATQHHHRLNSGGMLRRSHTHKLLVPTCTSPPLPSHLSVAHALAASIAESESGSGSRSGSSTTPSPSPSHLDPLGGLGFPSAVGCLMPTSPLTPTGAPHHHPHLHRPLPRRVVHRQTKSSVEDFSLRQLSRLALSTSTVGDIMSSGGGASTTIGGDFYRSSIESVAELLVPSSSSFTTSPPNALVTRHLCIPLAVSAPVTPMHAHAMPQGDITVPLSPILRIGSHTAVVEHQAFDLATLEAKLEASTASASMADQEAPSSTVSPSPLSPFSGPLDAEAMLTSAVSTPSFLVRALSDPTQAPPLYH